MMRDKLTNAILLLLAGGLFAVVLIPVEGQPTREITPFITFEGAISDGAGQERWTFNALAGEVISVVAEGEDGFDPVIEIVNADGELIVQNDDAAYPLTTHAIIEAMTIPRTGAYEIVVRDFSGEAGAYTLLFTHGYASVLLQNAADNAGWARQTGDVTVSGGDALTVGLEGINTFGVAANTRLPEADDFYAELSVAEVTARNDWSIGLSVRQQATQSVAILVNARGQWRADFIRGEERTTLREWTAHPAIVPDQTTFTLGVMGIGDGFDVFYDGQFMGQIVVDNIGNQGRIGVVVGTADAINSATEATIANLAITTPHMIAGNGVFPYVLIPGTPSQLVQELERRRLIPVGGQLPLNVSESFSESSRPGIALVELGRGATYTDFVMGATVEITLRSDSGAGPTGCGLLLRRAGENQYVVAYIDSDGGYGVSARDGESFAPGIFGENPAYVERETQDLLVVVRDDTLLFFVNGEYGGRMNVESRTGTVGNAQVNFEPNNATCDFSDTWLWTWGAG